VFDGGVLTTPAVQALCREEGFAAAIVVSASHNPAHDNGVKVFGADGRKLPDSEEAELEELIDRDAGPEVGRRRGATVRDEAAEDRYVRFLRERRLPHLDLAGRAVVLDCAHGAAYRIGPKVLAAFGARVDVRHAQPDGDNINRDAGVFFVDRLRGPVLENAPAVGFALDGDADRLLFVDEDGALRDGDDALGALAGDLHGRGLLAGARVVLTVMSNYGLVASLKRRGIAPDQVAVGDRNVAARMAETGAVLGGEQSGHVIFREDDRWCGDGLYTGLRLLDASLRARRPLADLCRGVERFPQVLLNVAVRSKPPVDQVPGLLADAQAAEATLQGEGRVLLRYSGTESILRVMVEGRDPSVVARLAEGLADRVRVAIGK